MASGSPRPSITWTIDGHPVPSGGALQMDSNTGTLTIPELTSSACLTYACTARNGFGMATENIEICGEGITSNDVYTCTCTYVYIRLHVCTQTMDLC